MAVILFKAISIAVKTLARPLINWVTYYNRMKLQESNHRVVLLIKGRLIWIGQTTHYYNTLLNRRLFGLIKDQEIKALPNDKALERGAEFISEVIVYTIILIVPLYEMIKSQKLTKAKEHKKKEFLINIQNDVDSLIEQNEQMWNNVIDIKQRIEDINSYRV